LKTESREEKAEIWKVESSPSEVGGHFTGQGKWKAEIWK
jgi:hypothetical protein